MDPSEKIMFYSKIAKNFTILCLFASFITNITLLWSSSTIVNVQVNVNLGNYYHSYTQGYKTVLSYHIPYEWIAFINNTWGTSHVFDNCPVSTCILSHKNFTKVHEPDAIIFKAQHVLDIVNKTKRGQIWIFTDSETPINYYFNNHNFLKQYVDVVNWTMGYRRDSDIFIPYGIFKTKKKPGKYDQLEKIIKRKFKMAVSYISNCFDKSKRLQYIKRLIKHGTEVEMFGLCAKQTCKTFSPLQCRVRNCWNRNFRFVAAANVTNVQDTCFDVLDTDFKFYLSFENSLCLDYVSEKSLDMILRHYVVPVIRDGANRSLYHPPGSYIDTADFNSTQQLANFLIKLNNDNAAYMEYFKWREYYDTEAMGLKQAFCKLCKMLHNPKPYTRLYTDVYSWFFSVDNSSVCRQANDVI